MIPFVVFYICYAPYLWLFPPVVIAQPEYPPIVITGPGMIEPKLMSGDSQASSLLLE